MRAIIGCGTSYYAALLYSSMSPGTRAWVASEYPGGFSDVTAISQSGETADVLRACAKASEEGARIHAVTNTPGSSLTQIASEVTLIGCGVERAVAATKSFTATLRALGVPLSKITKAQIDALVVPAVPQARCVLFLGAGQWYPLALGGRTEDVRSRQHPRAWNRGIRSKTWTDRSRRERYACDCTG